jgi:methionine-S-sulfoxide reductase
MAPLEKATFAAGCFWGVEAYYKRVKGVVRTTVGYTGGTKKGPSYEEVRTGRTGHAEAVEIEFDPKVVSFEKLLQRFWNLHDPTQKDKQGSDVGTQYRSAIFFHDAVQEQVAQRTKDALERSGRLKRPIATQIVPATIFYPAEDYHQDYLDKHPDGYCHVDVSAAEKDYPSN